MKFLLTIVFALFSACFYAQNFVPVGATWHYTNAVFYPFWEKMLYEKDTLIAGENCMKILRTRQRFVTGMNGTPVSLPPEHHVQYYSQHGDTLYDAGPGDRTVLFVFNLNPGDSWEVSAPAQQGSDTACILPNRTYVLDTGTVVINGKSLRYWDVGLNDSSFIHMQGRFIEQIGYMSSFLLNYNTNNCAGGVIECCTVFFTCLESDSIGFYNSSEWPYSACEYYYSLSEASGSAIRIFPNPATGRVYIYTGSDLPCTAELYDMQGRKIMQAADLTDGQSLELGALRPGVYVLQLSAGGVPLATQKIIKE